LFKKELFGVSPLHYGLLRDDGQHGDLKANDNFYSTRFTGTDLSEAHYFTLVRGPEGMFPEPEPDPQDPPGPDPIGGVILLAPDLPEPETPMLILKVEAENEQGEQIDTTFTYN